MKSVLFVLLPAVVFGAPANDDTFMVRGATSFRSNQPDESEEPGHAHEELVKLVGWDILKAGRKRASTGRRLAPRPAA